MYGHILIPTDGSETGKQSCHAWIISDKIHNWKNHSACRRDNLQMLMTCIRRRCSK